MLTILRSRLYQATVSATTGTFLLIFSVLPAFSGLALRSGDGGTLRHLLATRLGTADEALATAARAAMETDPGSLEEFVDAFLDELDEADSATARAALSRVLAGIPLEHRLDAGWLPESRWVAKGEHAQMLRTPIRAISRVTSGRFSPQTSGAVDASGAAKQGANLTRAQIRSTLSSAPLGP